MRQDEQVRGVILGCTEIFLLVDWHDAPDLPMSNTAKLYGDPAVEVTLSVGKCFGRRPLWYTVQSIFV